MPLVALNSSWAFAMPKKTASQSLVGMCEGVAEVQGEMHGAEWNGSGRRYMVVRNPYERLASMYWHMMREANYLFGGDPTAWLSRLIEMRPQRNKGPLTEWLVTQSEMAVQFQPDKVFRLEDGLQSVLDAIGVVVPMQHRNMGGDKRITKRNFAETFGDPPAAIVELCRPDMEAWYA